MSKPTSIDFYVMKTGRTYGVFVTYEQDGSSHDELVEGGFFGRDAAERCKREHLANVVASAERKAGWDGGR